MALIKFELKEDHIKLLKHLRWSMVSDQLVSRGDDTEENGDSPFGGDDLLEDMCIILNGKPDNFNPIDDEILVSTLSDADKADMLTLYGELPTALDIILYTSSFEPGYYKRKWYDRNWVKDSKKINI
jgi:hypothetical protein